MHPPKISNIILMDVSHFDSLCYNEPTSKRASPFSLSKFIFISGREIIIVKVNDEKYSLYRKMNDIGCQ